MAWIKQKGPEWDYVNILEQKPGTAFNFAANPYVHRVLQLVGAYGPAYRPPNRLTLSTRLMAEVRGESLSLHELPACIAVAHLPPPHTHTTPRGRER